MTTTKFIPAPTVCLKTDVPLILPPKQKPDLGTVAPSFLQMGYELCCDAIRDMDTGDAKMQQYYIN